MGFEKSYLYMVVSFALLSLRPSQQIYSKYISII